MGKTTSIDEKVLIACHRIEELYHETGGKCYISFSGGKDSTVLLALTKLCIDAYTLPAEGIPAIFSNTGIEMGITVDFVKWCKESGWYPSVEMIRPEKSFDWCLKTYGKPVRSKLRSEFLRRWQLGNRTENVYRSFVVGISNRGKHSGRTKLADRDAHFLSDDFPILASPMCCTILKKRPFKHYAKKNGVTGYAYGIRTDEGGARALNTERYKEQKGGKICTSISGGFIKKAPIIDWTDEDVEEFIKAYNVPLSKAYTEFGFNRTGCMACPFNPHVDWDLTYLHDHEPNRYKAAMHWLKDVYIAQGVKLPFDPEYEREREEMWKIYEPMRQEMLRKYRPNSRLIKDYQELALF